MADSGFGQRGRAAAARGVCALALALGAAVAPAARAQGQPDARSKTASTVVEPGTIGGQAPHVVGASPAAPRTTHVVLLTLDGVRWEDVFRGVDPELARKHGVPEADIVGPERLLPNVYERFVTAGTVIGAPGVGAPVYTSESALSLPGYVELLTGRRDGPCNSNRCLPVAVPTILDNVRRQPGAGPDAAAAISSWENILLAATASPTQVVVSAGRQYGWPTRERVRVDEETSRMLDAAAKVRPEPGHDDYRPDALTAPIALRYFEARRPRLMFIGLGDTDEYAHADDYVGYLRALRYADAFVGKLFEAIDALPDRGATTTVIFTTDHGRGADFVHHGRVALASRKVFVMAAGGAVRVQGVVPAAKPCRLADVAPTIRALMGLTPDRNRDAGAPIAELLPAAGPSGS